MKQQKPAKILNKAFIDVEWSESMSGSKPPMVPRKVIHIAIEGVMWSAERKAVAVKPLATAATLKWVEKFAKEEKSNWVYIQLYLSF